ncbi:ExbD/TolR family protein [Hymenobacter properus]|uniref:Biopolymer transporter ExbD n=1 Tax=Hymenobacter properus TaxID=2791026 RepID=A0A931FK01_9BACT|nr:biopolymer transporter ExbD [Hymenobacter properus]MBF9142483.1 biopolymer transporter ExbD [Hymenobacter properus]MBR7721290.1 biopolymer transporter ExbD [Microvirga sp. SRT04]
MAEIQGKADSGGKGGKKRAKKMSTKIDMTPMVDLAFLLLTFFMLTTTFAKPNVMQLTMPVKEKNPNPDEQTKIKASQAVTILLGKDNKAYYYFGLNTPNDPTVQKPELKVTNFSASGIRQVLLDRKRRAPEPIVLIKPTEDAKYKNMVDILDEMNITNQKKYALVKIDKNDENLIKDSGL